jgi:hypothetical protein
MRQKLKYQDVPNFCLWFLSPRRAHSELCNQSGDEKHGQKGKRDWYFNKCIIPKFWSHKFEPAPYLPMAGLVILIDSTYTSYMRMINAHYSWATG